MTVCVVCMSKKKKKKKESELIQKQILTAQG